MSVYTSKNAELFYKAIEDVWCSEQIIYGSPNIAVWHCTQAVEKTMKGYLRCINIEYAHSHSLSTLLDSVMTDFHLSEESEQYIIYLNDFQSTLRYKNMANDPSPVDARIAISRTKQIIQEFNTNPKVTQFMDEAKEVHTKVLKANYEHKE